MRINYVIHTPVGKILAAEIRGSGKCVGTLASSLNNGLYAPLVLMDYPELSSVVEQRPREITVKGERIQWRGK